MKSALFATTAIIFGSTAAFAGGLDRSGQPIGIIFQDGNRAEFALGRTLPGLTGTGLFTGHEYDNVGDAFSTLTGGLKMDLNDRFALALIYDQPFGSDVNYGGSSAATELGGTSAVASTSGLTAVLRYKIDDRFSVHGGVKIQTAEGEISFGGLAYGALNGYKVTLESDQATGWLAGAAYEIPDIALRVALTYSSEITHEMDTTETIAVAGVGNVGLSSGTETEVETPRSVNLDFQTGVAENTLVFGQVRWAEWSNFLISPQYFASVTGGGSISDLDNSTTYTLGVARRFTDRFAASVSASYEDPSSDTLVSPLAPTNGYTALTLGGAYELERMTISGGVRYTWVGNAQPETGTPDVARADFRDNGALSLGMKIAFNF